MNFFVASLFALALAMATLLESVSAVPALTSPVASTNARGGRMLRVAWDDNGNSPRVSTWGGINIFLATGDINTQFKLQQLATNLSVSTTRGSYAVDKSIGPNGQYYFIRMEGTEVNSTGIPPMAFSARFTLSEMTGTFNSTVQAAATGVEGSSGASSTSASGSGSSASSSTMRVSTSSTSSARTTNTASSSSSSSPSSAGKTMQSNVMLLLGSVFLAAAGFVTVM